MPDGQHEDHNEAAWEELEGTGELLMPDGSPWQASNDPDQHPHSSAAGAASSSLAQPAPHDAPSHEAQSRPDALEHINSLEQGREQHDKHRQPLPDFKGEAMAGETHQHPDAVEHIIPSEQGHMQHGGDGEASSDREGEARPGGGEDFHELGFPEAGDSPQLASPVPSSNGTKPGHDKAPAMHGADSQRLDHPLGDTITGKPDDHKAPAMHGVESQRLDHPHNDTMAESTQGTRNNNPQGLGEASTEGIDRKAAVQHQSSSRQGNSGLEHADDHAHVEQQAESQDKVESNSVHLRDQQSEAHHGPGFAQPHAAVDEAPAADKTSGQDPVGSQSLAPGSRIETADLPETHPKDPASLADARVADYEWNQSDPSQEQAQETPDTAHMQKGHHSNAGSRNSASPDAEDEQTTPTDGKDASNHRHADADQGSGLGSSQSHAFESNHAENMRYGPDWETGSEASAFASNLESSPEGSPG